MLAPRCDALNAPGASRLPRFESAESTHMKVESCRLGAMQVWLSGAKRLLTSAAAVKTSGDRLDAGRWKQLVHQEHGAL